MKITRDNYEIWFLDYQEGRLDKEGREEVRLFLNQYPDLSGELDAFSPALKIDSNLKFPDKDRLKREIFDDPKYFETTATAAMECDLTPDELAHFEEWLTKNPAKQEFISQLKTTKLQPDSTISFPRKANLKKKTTVMPFWVRIAAVAAALILALLLFKPEKIDSPTFLSTESIVTHRPIVTPDSGSYAKPTRILPKPSKQLTSKINSFPKLKKQVKESVTKRQFVVIQPIHPKTVEVYCDVPNCVDLAMVNFKEPAIKGTNEISLAEFLKSKLQALKKNGPSVFFSREEIAIAGLHLFARLPGNHLTGTKGNDGRLQSISFDTKILAFSIPVNR